MARAIPDDNLALPVLVEWDAGAMGSGFYVRQGDGAVFFVTARHVLFDPKTGKLCRKSVTLSSHQVDPADTRINQYTIDMTVVENNGNVRGHNAADVVVIRIAAAASTPASWPARFTSVVPGVTITGMSGTELTLIPLERNVKLFAEALVANEVYVFGDPRAIGLPNIPQIDNSRAILRKGIIAQKNLKVDSPLYGPATPLSNV